VQTSLHEQNDYKANLLIDSPFSVGLPI